MERRWQNNFHDMKSIEMSNRSSFAHAVDLVGTSVFLCRGKCLSLREFEKRIQRANSCRPAIETFVKDLLGLQNVRSLQFDLNNWNINADYDAFSITKRR